MVLDTHHVDPGCIGIVAVDTGKWLPWLPGVLRVAQDLDDPGVLLYQTGVQNRRISGAAHRMAVVTLRIAQFVGGIYRTGEGQECPC